MGSAADQLPLQQIFFPLFPEEVFHLRLKNRIPSRKQDFNSGDTDSRTHGTAGE